MRARPVFLVLFLLASLAGAAGDVDVTDTRLLAEPAASARHIAFAYDGDVWVASLDGGEVRRLTTAPGEERRPRFSPDGELLAFSGEYDGNVDVFVVPVAGGVPRRLTWHPDDDEVECFTPDGNRVLFRSPRPRARVFLSGPPIVSRSWTAICPVERPNRCCELLVDPRQTTRALA